MPIRQMRRLGPVVGDSLHDRMQANPLHMVYWRRWMDLVERKHKDLVIEDGPNLLVAEGHGERKLLYSFESDRVFVDRFPAMFEQLLPQLRQKLGDGTLRFRLAYFPARPMVEPVLKRLWFTPVRDWLEFTVERSSKLPAPPSPRGIRFREGGPGDVPGLLRVDRECFPDTPMLPEGIRARIKQGEHVLIAEHKGEIAGFCLYSQPDPRDGYIHVVAVAEAERGRGIGATLTARACKRLFAEGASSVSLTTDQDSGPAIRLYRRLGFRQTRAGRDYVRPTDPDAVTKIATDRRGTLIRFGGWR